MERTLSITASMLASGMLGLLLVAGPASARIYQDRGTLDQAGFVSNDVRMEQLRIDSGITTEVQARLHDDRMLSRYPISVSTLNGVVTLTGVVHSPSERDTAAMLAQADTDVRRVQNQIQLSANIPVVE